MGEDKRIREAMVGFRMKLQDHGYNPREAAKTARECAIRADRRKRGEGDR